MFVGVKKRQVRGDSRKPLEHFVEVLTTPELCHDKYFAVHDGFIVSARWRGCHILSTRVREERERSAYNIAWLRDDGIAREVNIENVLRKPRVETCRVGVATVRPIVAHVDWFAVEVHGLQ